MEHQQQVQVDYLVLIQQELVVLEVAAYSDQQMPMQEVTQLQLINHQELVEEVYLVVLLPLVQVLVAYLVAHPILLQE